MSYFDEPVEGLLDDEVVEDSLDRMRNNEGHLASGNDKSDNPGQDPDGIEYLFQ